MSRGISDTGDKGSVGGGSAGPLDSGSQGSGHRREVGGM